MDTDYQVLVLVPACFCLAYCLRPNLAVHWQQLQSTMHQQDPFDIFTQPLQRPHPQTEDPLPSKRLHIDPQEEPQPEDKSESQSQDHTKRLENITIETIRTEEGCIHEIYYPSGYQRRQFHGEPKAKKYPFKLDPFQHKAVVAIESDESVLVCAHTSAGKTAIAEYAIALSLKNNSRVIYTSPIKALSNQKYRELKEEFGDVGLVTGDVAIDQSATCLVMTTEILRNMIYRGSEIVREVKWVIFDEVHYMRDKERGVVWEETIIMLPANVKYVFLSATIGNPGEFAMWIAKLRKQPCNVVYTDYRPVPLEHYLCPSGGDGLYLVVDDKSKFHEDNFQKAISSLSDGGGLIGVDKKKKNNNNQGSDLSKIIKTIMERQLDPVIVFSFSKKDVQSYARSICTKYDLTTKAEKEKIELIYGRSLLVLEEKDRQLPAIQAMKQIVKKGVGIHHGGLLPLVKEVVELLFQQGLLKVLFSTETFSMGLNMPARTVVFTSIKKFDGQKSRWLTGGEYIQMSGRAGRRGLDKKGSTILMFDEKMEIDIAKAMLKGHSDNLLSSFYINYHMLLNSQRLEDIDLEYILARSLLQFQQDSQLPALKQVYFEKQQQFSIPFSQEQDLETLYLLKERLAEHKQDLRKIFHQPQKILPFLNIGRIIHLVDGPIDWGYGISINFHKKEAHKKSKGQSLEPIYLVDCLVYIKPREKFPNPTPVVNFKEEGEIVVLTFSISCILEVTSLKIANMPNDLNMETSKDLILKTMREVTEKKIKSLPIDSNEPEAVNLKVKISKVEEEIEKFKDLEPRLEQYKQRKKQYEELKDLGKKIKEKSGLVLMNEMRAYSRVIKRAGLVDRGVVSLKGRVTCEINSNHQILLTDLIFTGYFNDMTPIEIASIVSSLVHEEKSSTERMRTKLPRLRQKLEELIVRAKGIFLIFKECKTSVDEDDYVDTIKEQLIEITFDWCNGACFEDICKKTDSYEGSIIRTWRRLHELLKDLSTSAREIGNGELSTKFSEASDKVNRGIVVAASLYVL